MLQKIANLICDVAENEEKKLRKLSNKGIMNCPELAFVYLVAKKVSEESEQIFGQSIDWELEKSDKKKDIRRLDLYIKASSPNVNVAIEFKLGYEVREWEKDVDKLLKIKDLDNLSRMFCVLLTDDVNKIPKENKRIKKFSTNDLPVKSLKLIGFPSLAGGPKKQCIIGIWEVLK